MSHPPTRPDRVLVTGATGYVGGRLLGALHDEGYRLRSLARRPEAVTARFPWIAEAMRGDVLDPATLEPALEGIDAAYYLVHSMGSRGNFAAQDLAGAGNFAAAAKRARVQRIVYLGGLGAAHDDLSDHLRSRQETGQALAQSGVPVIELRASIVLGSGSASFEMIRALVERLPVMICPKWVETPAQPIAIEDLIRYLIAALTIDASESRVFEIGGAEQATYGDIMREYARQRGLHRLMINVPFLTPRLSSLWLGLVTPLYARVGRKLVDSLRNPTVVLDSAAQDVFAIRPRGLRDAIARALANEDREIAETRWSDALSSAGPAHTYGGVRFGSRLVDTRTMSIHATPEQAFAPILRIGGASGWYCANALWQLRALIDLWLGGVGMRRGRRDPVQLRVGDSVDFWRVEQIEPNRLLRLSAEMRLPGRAWLQFEVEDHAPECVIRQTALFDPKGLGGLVYWYAMYPFHAWIFQGMLRRIGRLAAEPHHSG